MGQNEVLVIDPVDPQALNPGRIEALAARADELPSGEREERLKNLIELEAKVRTLEKLYGSPQTVLAGAGLGSIERGRYMTQLAAARPTELTDAARWAIATGDRSLAAAVMTLNGRLLAQSALQQPPARRGHGRR